MDIIEKIQAKGQQIRQKEIESEAAKRLSVEEYYKAAQGLSDRINKLWDICQALLDNGFKLGKPSYHAGFTYYEFETEGWYHWLGFLRSRNKIIAFGVCGGGCCGRSVYINRKGKVGTFNGDVFVEDDIDRNCYISQGDNYAPRVGKTYQDPDFYGKLKQIVNGFDKFESDVLKYVDEITK